MVLNAEVVDDCAFIALSMAKIRKMKKIGERS